MAKVKTAEELMAEAEELQKKVAPELYGLEGEGGTSDEDDDKGTPGEPAPEDGNQTPTETDEEKAARLKAEEDAAKKAADDAGALDPRDEEIARLKDELVKVKATAGRVAQTAEANDRLRERIAVLEAEIAGLKESPPKKEPPTPTADDAELKELIDEYGENSVEVRRYKRDQERIALLEKTISEVRGEIREIPARTAADKYVSTLAEQVPDWESIRDNPEFHAFLTAKASPLSRRTVYDELKEADNAKDSATTVAIYKAFKEKSASAAVKKSDDTPPSKKDKAALLAPGSSGKAADAKGTPEVYTVAEVQQMTKEIQTLRARGDHKKADAIKAKLDAFQESLGSFS